jgi:hypothetical protein
MEATPQPLTKTPRTIPNLNYASAALSVLAYICSGYDVNRRPEYPYNFVIIPFLCTLVHHYFILSTTNSHQNRPEVASALSIKNILSIAVLSGFWFIAVHVHVSMNNLPGEGGIVPTMSLAKTLGTVEAIVLAAMTWEAGKIRFL